jgi:hypothetical protein
MIAPPKSLQDSLKKLQTLVAFVDQCVQKSVYVPSEPSSSKDVNSDRSAIYEPTNIVSVPDMAKPKKLVNRRKLTKILKSKEIIEDSSSDGEREAPKIAPTLPPKKVLKLKNYPATRLQPLHVISPAKPVQACGGKNLSLVRAVAAKQQQSTSSDSDSSDSEPAGDEVDTLRESSDDKATAAEAPKMAKSDADDAPKTPGDSQSDTNSSNSESSDDDDAEPVQRREPLDRAIKNVAEKPDATLEGRCTYAVTLYNHVAFTSTPSASQLKKAQMLLSKMKTKLDTMKREPVVAKHGVTVYPDVRIIDADSWQTSNK